jgi:dethiobiotin synthetase
MTRACFVTATGTEVGKTVLTAVIAAGLAAAGVPVRVRKPILTGASEGHPRSEDQSRDPHASSDSQGRDLGGLADHELLAAVSGERSEDVAANRYAPAVSPHLAAELSGVQLDLATIVAELRALAEDADALVVEGIGGLLVPLADGWDVRRLARELALPVVIAASPGLGTINHTLLTLEAARAAGLDVRAVVLTPWPAQPATLELSNRATIAALGAIEVATLPLIGPITQATLAQVATGLGYQRWLEPQ